MAQRALEQRVDNLEHRVANVEQILPTLATKTDLENLRLATKTDLENLRLATKTDLEDLRLATKTDLAELKAELKAESEETRRHFDVVAEGLRDEIKLVADGVAVIQATTDARHADVMRVLTQHDRRLTRLEAARKSR